MNDTYIVTSYVVIDDMLKAWGCQDDCRAIGYGAEILPVAVIAAKYFHNQHQRALCMLMRLGYVSGLRVSRFNRRLHKLGDWLQGIVGCLAELYRQGQVFVMDSMPLLVCKRARAHRCKKGEILWLALASNLHRKWHTREF